VNTFIGQKTERLTFENEDTPTQARLRFISDRIKKYGTFIALAVFIA